MSKEAKQRNEFGDWMIDHMVGITTTLVLLMLAAGGLAIWSLTSSHGANDTANEAVKQEPIIQELGSPCRTQIHRAGPLSLLQSGQCTQQARALILVTCEMFPVLRSQAYCHVIFAYFHIKPEDLIAVNKQVSTAIQGGGALSPPTGSQLPEGNSPPNQGTRITAAKLRTAPRLLQRNPDLAAAIMEEAVTTAEAQSSSRRSASDNPASNFHR